MPTPAIAVVGDWGLESCCNWGIEVFELAGRLAVVLAGRAGLHALFSNHDRAIAFGGGGTGGTKRAEEEE